jgi:hypothetical protein
MPGLLFVIGLSIPLHPIPFLKALLGEDWTPALGISELLLLVAFSFVCGQMLQTAGGRFDGDHGFADLMGKIRSDGDSNLSEFEENFWKCCQKEFSLNNGFSSYDMLFNAVLAHLESCGRHRALRMQALYLFARGVYVGLRFLAVIYIVIYISVEYGFLPMAWRPFVRTDWLVLSAAIAVWILGYSVDGARRELENDWIEYTITEFYLDTKDHLNDDE